MTHIAHELRNEFIEVREPPQRSQEGNRQQGFFAVRAWCPSWATW